MHTETRTKHALHKQVIHGLLEKHTQTGPCAEGSTKTNKQARLDMIFTGKLEQSTVHVEGPTPGRTEKVRVAYLLPRNGREAIVQAVLLSEEIAAQSTPHAGPERLPAGRGTQKATKKRARPRWKPTMCCQYTGVGDSDG